VKEPGLAFEKIEACGNDFVLLREVPRPFPVAAICDRHYGLGADGIMVFSGVVDGRVVLDHYDPDGSRTFCLNGVRAGLHCLAEQGLIAPAGAVSSEGMAMEYLVDAQAHVILPRRSCREFTWRHQEWEVPGFIVEAGNPQFVTIDTMSRASFARVAPLIRGDLTSFPEGTNVNLLVPQPDGGWRITSYERGVEGFTLACGSGIYASAEALFTTSGRDGLRFFPDGKGSVTVMPRGEHLVMTGTTHWVASGVWRC